jgi:hypothetical protein
MLEQENKKLKRFVLKLNPDPMLADFTGRRVHFPETELKPA